MTRRRAQECHGRDHTTYANITGLFLVRGGVDETATADNADCSVGSGPVRLDAGE
jgi:hypothetical protein